MSFKFTLDKGRIKKLASLVNQASLSRVNSPSATDLTL